MPDPITIVRFDGPGPFVLPPTGGQIKVCQMEGTDDLCLEWPLPLDPGQTQRFVQLPVKPEYAMALMRVLQNVQQEFGLEVPKGHTTDRRFH